MAPDEKIETIDAFNRIPIIIESVFHISCSIIRLKNNNSEFGISQSIKLGISNSFNNAYMFIVCDQPHIKKETINKFINEFIRSKKNLGCVSNDGILLNPTIFTDKYKDKLLKLDGDKGGKKIILKNIDDLFIFDVLEKRELIDIDYKSQLENK